MRAARRRPQMNVVQPARFDGEVKMIAPITLEAVADAVIAERLCTVDELEQWRCPP